MKRVSGLALFILLVVLCVSAFADGSWTCPACQFSGNTGNFCQNCGAAAPVDLTVWNCASCGQQGNTGNFCSNCGASKATAGLAPDAEAASVATATPKPAATLKPVVSSVKAGDYIKFGHYEQDNVNANGTEVIQWRVLTVQDGKAFVVSRYGLYRTTANSSSNGCAWADSDLRSWLNKTFYYEAFSSSERSAIQLTSLTEKQEYCGTDWNPAAKRVGVSTSDYIFVLSEKEMITYLPSNADRQCIPTDYAIGQGCNKSSKKYDGNRTCWYWLRTPAYKNNFLCVDWDGTIASCYMSHTYGVVRPALWVNLSAIGY